MLVGELENIFRPILNYNSLFVENREAFEAYDYTFDWSKDVLSTKSNIPWTQINAARLYHLLNGNIVINLDKRIKHDAGFGEKDTDLYEKGKEFFPLFYVFQNATAFFKKIIIFFKNAVVF